jgi:hypothetical protein
LNFTVSNIYIIGRYVLGKVKTIKDYRLLYTSNYNTSLNNLLCSLNFFIITKFRYFCLYYLCLHHFWRVIFIIFWQKSKFLFKFNFISFSLHSVVLYMEQAVRHFSTSNYKVLVKHFPKNLSRFLSKQMLSLAIKWCRFSELQN